MVARRGKCPRPRQRMDARCVCTWQVRRDGGCRRSDYPGGCGYRGSARREHDGGRPGVTAHQGERPGGWRHQTPSHRGRRARLWVGAHIRGDRSHRGPVRPARRGGRCCRELPAGVAVAAGLRAPFARGARTGVCVIRYHVPEITMARWMVRRRTAARGVPACGQENWGANPRLFQ